MLPVTALAADVHRHVLHHTQDRHVHLAKHLYAFLGVHQGDVLGSGHNDSPRHGGLLRQGELDVTGTGGHVDNEVIQLPPKGLLQHLPQGAARHGAAPDHGGALGDEVAHGHGLEPVGLHRQQVLPVLLVGPHALGNPQHQLLAGAVDVGIEQPHPAAPGQQGQRQVDRGGGLADPALARGYGDDVLDLVHAQLSVLDRGNAGGVPVRHAR